MATMKKNSPKKMTTKQMKKTKGGLAAAASASASALRAPTAKALSNA